MGYQTFYDRWRPESSSSKNRNYHSNNNINGQRSHHYYISHNGNQLSGKDTTSFYVTNFPETMMFSDLWRVCNRIRKVVGVFISKSKSRLGKRFGFIRFVGVKDSDAMIKTLCGVWFGYYKLFASTPRFSISEKVGKPSTTGSLFNTLDKNLSQPNSYANVVRGNPKAN